MAVYIHAQDYLKKEYGKVYDFLINLFNEFCLDLKTFKIAK
ncbi:MAG: hypothetical protein ACO3E1_08400 [Flavobacteriales bacterium]